MIGLSRGRVMRRRNAQSQPLSKVRGGGYLTTLCGAFLTSALLTLASGVAVPKNRSEYMDHLEWGPETANQAVAIWALGSHFRPGDPIVLNFALKNFGKTAVPIIRQSPWVDYSLEVRWQGADLKRTPYADQRIDAAAEGRRIFRELRPEEMVTDELELDRAYPTTAPGIYRIVATRSVSVGAGAEHYATVTSNVLEIRIAAAQNAK